MLYSLLILLPPVLTPLAFDLETDRSPFARGCSNPLNVSRRRRGTRREEPQVYPVMKIFTGRQTLSVRMFIDWSALLQYY